jgi:hypothetical protein
MPLLYFRIAYVEKCTKLHSFVKGTQQSIILVIRILQFDFLQQIKIIL